MAYEFDLLTIGAGSGGVAGSRRAAAYGPRVGIIEEARIGGTCVLRGCVPKKLLIYGVDIADTLADAAGFGWSIDGASLDWRKLIAAKDNELDRLHGIYVSMLDKAGVARIEGRGVLVDPHTVQVGDRRVTAERILIATGGWPTVPDIPGKELMITSNEALDLKNLPERIVIYGAGYIAVEFAGIFRAAGCTVDLVFRGDQVLRGFDGEVRAHLTDSLAARGINLLPGRTIASVAEEGAARRVTLSDGSVILAGQVMAATGRAPNTKGLGLEAVGVQTGAQGEIIVDNWSRTSVPSIYAVGDVTNRFNLTPVAIAEARAVAETLYNQNPMSVFENIVPTAVFSRPEVGTVGLSEEAALAASHTLDIYTTRFRPMKNTISGRAERTFMKLVVDQPSQRVLGAHMVGPDAAEIVQGLAVALTCGATKQQFDRTIGLHPSAAEEFVTLRDKRT
ncbi:glutathione-disulfide reductase [Elstera cyanobacteriorum]|uniref:Glutathione reductase n=1 Tax=Elstera cyanobacteriorum TaxID=2022747 RepID=A0A255XWK9_9PROT|nr:glutathione-disulfide reductase [Elstera cyanobacteriorum]OYQ21407.1 glutathione-disulfide reductase [Elstera cyanobacteriorum]GFZ96807.1 glutathione-disulfide reductase [Elstera cyanobacteriorum]